VFKKLISNLPFNPSILNQVGFYSHRLHQEKSIRRLGFVFMALAVAVQSLAVISPPERSLAAGNNSIINGIKTKQDIINAWNNDPTVPKIYGKFGVTLDDIKALSDTPNSKVRSNDGNDWWSIGRNSLTSYTNVADTFKSSQVAIQYDANSYVYYRQLKSWDIRNPYNTYDAFKGTASETGEPFWLLIDCGNLTRIGEYTPAPVPNPTPTPTPTPTPVPVKPTLDLRKTFNKPTETLKPGDTFSFRFEYRNKTPDSLAKDVYITDSFDIKNFDILSPKDLPINNGYLKYPVGNLMFTPNYKELNITVRLKNPLPTPTKICNVSSLIASNASPNNSDAGCVNVINPCPYDTDVLDVNNPECVKPKVVCSVVDTIINRTTRKVTYKTTTSSTNDKLVNIISYNYDFGDGIKQTLTSSDFTNTTTHVYDPGQYTANVLVSFTAPTDSGTTSQQTSCSQNISFDADQPLGQSKTVRNITQKFDTETTLANKVKAGDTLEYILTTVNSQNYDRTGVKIEDYIGDLLDYSTLDTEALKSSGGTFDTTSKKITWDNVDIMANSQLNKVFIVNLLNPIPATNSPTATSTDFDCRISNQYGNELTLEVQCPIVKGIETIPNTGPGTSMTSIFLITTVVGYFFARSRLLDKEVNIVRTDYTTSGGM